MEDNDQEQCLACGVPADDCGTFFPGLLQCCDLCNHGDGIPE